MASVEDIKKLREQTGAGIADCRVALDEAGDDLEKAQAIIRKKGLDKASSKSDREVKAGLIDTYTHGSKIGVVIELLCETDFVAKTDDFKTLAHEIALQVTAMNPENAEELLAQEYIRDNSKTIEQLIKEAIIKLGENIQLGKFARLELGK